MTRTVLYASSDMEPITVIDLPKWARTMLESGERVRFALPPKPITVSIWSERFVRRGKTYFLLFTDDDVMVLLLRSRALAGQHGLLSVEYSRGVRDGIIKALHAFGGDA